MDIISLALTAFGFTADAVGIGAFLAESLSKRDRTTGADLFSRCFTTAVKRLSTDLGEVAEIQDQRDVSADPEKLKGAMPRLTKGM